MVADGSDTVVVIVGSGRIESTMVVGVTLGAVVEVVDGVGLAVSGSERLTRWDWGAVNCGAKIRHCSLATG